MVLRSLQFCKCIHLIPTFHHAERAREGPISSRPNFAVMTAGCRFWNGLRWPTTLHSSIKSSRAHLHAQALEREGISSSIKEQTHYWYNIFLVLRSNDSNDYFHSSVYTKLERTKQVRPEGYKRWWFMLQCHQGCKFLFCRLTFTTQTDRCFARGLQWNE